MISLQLSDQELIPLIRENSDNLGIVYKKTKDYCIKFLRNMNSGSNISDLELHDIYHDGVIILYEKILNKNFKLTCSFQTYLNSVCRFQLLNKYKEVQKSQDVEESLKVDSNNTEEFDASIMDILEPISDQNEIEFIALEKAMIALKKTGGKCYELLTMFWYQKKSMKEISKHFGYSNSDNAKNQKSRCQKRLQKEAFDNLKKI